MLTFTEFIKNELLETLKIVKKRNDTTSSDISKPQTKPRESKRNFEKKIDISYFDTVNIVRSKHTKEIRTGQTIPRDEGLRDAIIIKAIKKAWKKGLKPYVKTMISYKNKKKKYDLIVVEWQKKQNKIIIVTVIQDSKKTANDYFTPKHKNDAKIMTEKEIVDIQETIELDILED
jgi:hypothetical protein